MLFECPWNHIRDNLSNVFFLLDDSLASDFYVPAFWNTVCSIFIGSVSRKLWKNTTFRAQQKFEIKNNLSNFFILTLIAYEMY